MISIRTVKYNLAAIRRSDPSLSNARTRATRRSLAGDKQLETCPQSDSRVRSHCAHHCKGKQRAHKGSLLGICSSIVCFGSLAYPAIWLSPPMRVAVQAAIISTVPAIDTLQTRAQTMS